MSLDSSASFLGPVASKSGPSFTIPTSPFGDAQNSLVQLEQDMRSDSALKREAALTAERNASALAKASISEDARARGDVVNISEAAKGYFDQYKYASAPSGREMPHATMQGMTSRGTEVTVEATSRRNGALTMGGLSVEKHLTGLTMGGTKAGPGIDMDYSVTFRQQSGQVSVFEITANSIFREALDGTIEIVPAGGGALTGSDKQDIMINISDNTSIAGNGGDDLIFNMGKNATILGGEGDDVIMSMGDHSVVGGGEGDDAIAILHDTLRAPFDLEEADAQPETDEKSVYKRPRHSQSVTVDAGNGDDSIVLSPTMYKSTISGGAGMDDIYANDLIHSKLDAGDGSDMVQVGKATKTNIVLGAGDDMLTALELLKSTVKAGDGNDVLHVDKATQSTLSGDNGDDWIEVESASQTPITGGGGDDYIRVHSGASLTAGGTGNDMIWVDGGIAMGQEGNDLLAVEHGGIVGNADHGATIDGGPGDDIIMVSDSATIAGVEKNDTLIGLQNPGTSQMSEAARNSLFEKYRNHWQQSV